MFRENPFARKPSTKVYRSLTPEEKIHFNDFLNKIEPDRKYTSIALVKIFNSTCGTNLTQDELRDIKEIQANFYNSRFTCRNQSGNSVPIDIYIKITNKPRPVFLTLNEADLLAQVINNSNT